jgi:hypothetical protein
MATNNRTKKPESEVHATQVLRPDNGLLSVWGEFWMAYNNARERYARVVYYIIEHKLTRRVIFDTLLMAGRPYGTANTYSTHLSNLAKPRNSGLLKDLAAGKLTIEEARRLSGYSHTTPRLNDEENRLAMIERKFCEIAERAREFEFSLEVIRELAVRSIEAVYARDWGTEKK